MDKLRIRGGNKLIGEIRVSGAKNSALTIMPACLLTSGKLVLTNVSHVRDVSNMLQLLRYLGCEFTLKYGHNGEIELILDASTIDNFTAPYELVTKMRASILVLGPMLAKFGRAKVSLPGGCAIGVRPIDLHLDILKQMGADIQIEGGYVIASINGKLKGIDYTFRTVSVGATENALMAATLADGVTILRNAAKEPEIIDLCHCLQAMGAKISGIGTHTITIEGVDSLHGANYKLISDRIEAGTYAVAAAVTGGDITLTNIEPEIVESSLDILRKIGVNIETGVDFIRVRAADTINPIEISTQPHPGLPTDMQAQFMVLLSLADGTSIITETLYENRFMHVPEMNRMGANIVIKGNKAYIHGVKKLRGAEVMSSDLRASFALLLAGLIPENEETIVHRVYHLDRGYERIEEKLTGCGAVIFRDISDRS